VIFLAHYQQNRRGLHRWVRVYPCEALRYVAVQPYESDRHADPSVGSRSRSTFTLTGGVQAENVVYTPTNPGVAFAAATKSFVAFVRTAVPRPARSSKRMEKPPALPMPDTGGGCTTRILAPGPKITGSEIAYILEYYGRKLPNN
jgi:hypothetical protein